MEDNEQISEEFRYTYIANAEKSLHFFVISDILIGQDYVEQCLNENKFISC